MLARFDSSYLLAGLDRLEEKEDNHHRSSMGHQHAQLAVEDDDEPRTMLKHAVE